MRDSFVLYRSVFDALMAFPPEEEKTALGMIGRYAMDGVLPETDGGVAYGLFLSVRPLIDKAVAKSEGRSLAGRLGGVKTQANGSKSEANGSKQEANDKQTEAYKGEIRKEKGEINILASDKSLACRTQEVQRVISEWNSITGIPAVTACRSGTKRYNSLVARLGEYELEKVLTAIGNIRGSRFLRGENGKGWVITFDWFVKPNNFIKVLEGNYTDTKADHAEGQYDDYEQDWTSHL